MILPFLERLSLPNAAAVPGMPFCSSHVVRRCAATSAAATSPAPRSVRHRAGARRGHRRCGAHDAHNRPEQDALRHRGPRTDCAAMTERIVPVLAGAPNGTGIAAPAKNVCPARGGVSLRTHRSRAGAGRRAAPARSDVHDNLADLVDVSRRTVRTAVRACSRMPSRLDSLRADREAARRAD